MQTARATPNPKAERRVVKLFPTFPALFASGAPPASDRRGETRDEEKHDDESLMLEQCRQLSEKLDEMRFSAPVAYVYNPLSYAFEPFAEYVRRYGGPPKRAVLLGMNPGPWGMAQTGIPFGEVNLVRDWLGIESRCGKPTREHPKRQVQGLDCTRSEVSGARLWGWARERFKKPEEFFSNFFVYNYCPLLFLEESGRNRTPDKLKAAEKRPLFEACDAALRCSVEKLQPDVVIGVGRFAEERARRVLGDSVKVASILHPSPASPAANRGWTEHVDATLAKLGLL